MKLNNANAVLFIPDNENEEKALSRTTDLCISAHQDDIEIMAFGPISKCYDDKSRWFSGVVVTDGAGSPRSGIYSGYTDDEMKLIRIEEQKKAASVGNYSSQFLLGYKSSEVKIKNDVLIKEIADIITISSPEILYTHNLTDKHDTHVAVALRVIEAIRLLPFEKRPKKIYSLEVWRGLDWLCDNDKTVFDTSKHENLAAALLGVFDSQIAGGKRYDKAAMGRRLANATFFASHDTDECDSISFGIDITDMVNTNTDPSTFILKYIDSFKNDISDRIEKLK